jgi:hypothetical protein
MFEKCARTINGVCCRKSVISFPALFKSERCELKEWILNLPHKGFRVRVGSIYAVNRQAGLAEKGMFFTYGIAPPAE